MKKTFQWLMGIWVAAAVAANMAVASENRVIVDLSEQRAYLVEQGNITLISPIASGKPGWSTPTGQFHVLRKDANHRSASFGFVMDASGRVVNSNATPKSHVPNGGHYRSASMPYYVEFSPGVGMHAGYLPGYPSSHGCVRMPRDLAARFFGRVQVGMPVTVVGNARSLVRVRKAIPVLKDRPLMVRSLQ